MLNSQSSNLTSVKMLTEKLSTINDANANTFSLATDLDTGSSSDLFSKSDPVNRIRRVSVSSSGVEASGSSFQPVTSNSGRYIAFASGANNLVPGDTNGVNDIFVYDSKKRTTKRISVGLNGTQANAASMAPSISDNGRYIAFSSSASNLVDGDTNEKQDIFVYDMKTGQMRLVSKNSSGIQADGSSGDGFISGDGRYVAFSSNANNLQGGESDNSNTDVFLHDLQTGSTTFITRGNEGPSFPLNLIFALARDISTDGRYILYENGPILPTQAVKTTLNIYDRETGTSKLVAETNPALGFGGSTLSGDGRYAAYVTLDTELRGVFSNPRPATVSTISVFDRQTGTSSTVLPAANGAKLDSRTNSLSISDDGRYLAFESFDSKLVDGDTNGTADVFVHDRQSGQTKRISVDAKGSQGNNPSYNSFISGNGRAVAFASGASNLVPGDTNNVADIFVARNFFS